MRMSSRTGAVQEDGGGRCACFLEAELTAPGESESGLEGAAEELEQHIGGEVLPEESRPPPRARHRNAAAGGCERLTEDRSADRHMRRGSSARYRLLPPRRGTLSGSGPQTSNAPEPLTRRNPLEMGGLRHVGAGASGFPDLGTGSGRVPIHLRRAR
jgi:hypothetical protein